MSRNQANLARYFVALLPPSNLQAEVITIQQEVWQAYQSKAALRSPPHLTLQPPFLWPEEDLETLQDSLAIFAQKRGPVPIKLSGFGAFPPRVIYVHVGHQGRLVEIQPELLKHFAETLGIVDRKAQNCPFTPHMTVAFRDLKPAQFSRAWLEFEQRPFEARFTAKELTLLKHDGQKWQISAQFPFLTQ